MEGFIFTPEIPSGVNAFERDLQRDPFSSSNGNITDWMYRSGRESGSTPTAQQCDAWEAMQEQTPPGWVERPVIHSPITKKMAIKRRNLRRAEN